MAPTPGWSVPPQYQILTRVYWEDTDAGGVVYYANYLKFMERCRTDWLRALGIDQLQLRAARGLQFAVVSVAVDFLRPAVLNDEIIVTAELLRLSGATIAFKQTIMRGDAQLIDANTRVACIDSGTLKPRPIPKDLFVEWRNGQ
jgi:acyl-CoA thioester hydrolase